MKLKNNKNIFCSVSAGYSSVMMATMMSKWYPDHNIIYVMANTSKERAESLEFMNECDKHFGLKMYWIESIINSQKGVGSGFKVVDYKDLKRDGEIFESGIKVYGIPSKINKWCNREMKLIPLTKFADFIFGKNNYSVAVGLRADEIDRVRKDYRTNNVFYPLIDNKIDSRLRNKFWKDQPIKLKIPSYKGNCDLCFAKSNRKNMTVLTEEPKVGFWWGDMEDKYSEIPIEGKDSYNTYAENGGHFFYRGNTSLKELVLMAQNPLKKATDEYIYEYDLFDAEDECGSGCVVF